MSSSNANREAEMKITNHSYSYIITVGVFLLGFLLCKAVTKPSVDMGAVTQTFNETQSINLKMQEWRNSSNKLGLVQLILTSPSINYLDFSIEEVKLKIIEMEQRIAEISDDDQRIMIENEIKRAKHALQLAAKYKSNNK